MKKIFKVMVSGSAFIEGKRIGFCTEMAARSDDESIKKKLDEFIADWILNVIDKSESDIEKTLPVFWSSVADFEGMELLAIENVFKRVEANGSMKKIVEKNGLEILMKMGQAMSV